MGAQAAVSIAQLGFGDIGVDPGHYHTVWGIDPDGEEMGLGAYVARDEARTAMDYWIREAHWQERRVPDSRTEDRADYRIEEDDSVDGYKLGWIRVVECADWKCRKAGTVQGAER